MIKETMNIEEIVLVPNTEVIEAAEQVAITSSEKEKYSFIIEYDINEKEFLISVMEKAGCVIEEIVDPESKIIVSMNKDQLKVIKALDCVNRVSANDDYENVVAVMETTPETVAMTVAVTELQTASLETEASYTLAANTAVAAAVTTAGSTMDTAIELRIDQWKSGSIECECGEAWFKFTANASAAHWNGGYGEYTITTSSTIDTKGYLYNSSGSMIDKDDDGGTGVQFSITASLKYGSTYYVRVKEYNCRAGDFNIKVTYTPLEYTGEDMARAFALPLGTLTYGNLCCPEGAVWYKFVANDTDAHSSGYAKYNVTIDSTCDVTVNMYDSNNQSVSFYETKKNGNELVKSAKLFYGLTYYVVVEAANQECGDYSITVDGVTQWVSVTSVTVDQTSLELPEGHTERLTATVSPSNATNKNIIWSTSDSTCADVSVATGVVMAEKAGDVTITAKSSDNNKSAIVRVTVTTEGSAHDCGGNTMATATNLPFDTWVNGTIKCSKGEEWYKFTATTMGEYTIKGQSDFDSVAYLYDSYGEEITYSDDTETDNDFCIKTDLGEGTYYVRVKSFWPGSGDYSIMVIHTYATTGEDDVVKVNSITLSKSELTMVPGETCTISAAILPDNAENTSLLWSSDNKSVATVNGGTISAIADGSAIITAIAADGGGASAQCAVTVETNNAIAEDMANAITLPLDTWVSGGLCCPECSVWYRFTSNASSAHTNGGNGEYIISISGDLDIFGILYDSNGNEIATSANNGTSNDFIITASLESNKTYYICIMACGSNIRDYNMMVTYTPATTEEDDTVKVSSIILSENEVKMKPGETFVLGATILPNNAENTSLQWSSNNKGVATVNGGTISAIADGSAIITAIAADGGGASAQCNVTVGTNHASTADMAEATTLPLGTWVDGCICCPEGAVWYKFAANDAEAHATGETVKYDISAKGSLDTRATLYDSEGNQIEWKDSGGTKNNFKIYRELTYGETYYVKVEAFDQDVGSYSICVSALVAVKSVTIDVPQITSMQRGEKMQLFATVLPECATNKKIAWVITKPQYADVTTFDGIVTAKRVGEIKVTALSLDDRSIKDTCDLKIIGATTTVPLEEDASIKNEETEKATVADPVDVYSGAHTIKNTLIRLFGGQNLNITAHYNSTNLVSGSLGKGWYHNYEKHLIVQECEAYIYDTPSSYYKLQSCNSTYVFEGVTPTRYGYVMTVDHDQVYPYCVNCNYERYEYYDVNGRLAKIIDHCGFETLISYSENVVTITDSITGKSINLEKNTDGLITRIYDASRSVTLTYRAGDEINCKNCLQTICDVNGKNLEYTYDPVGRILTGKDSEGVVFFTNTYDDSGRVATQKDGLSGSLTTVFGYTDDNTRISTNRNGDKSARIFNDDGLLVKYIDEENYVDGANINNLSLTNTYSYDGCFNLTVETDGLGNSTKKTYNTFNKPTQIIDKNGNKTTFTYDDKGNVTKITYPECDGVVATERFVYNERNQLTQHVDTRGTLTRYTYDSNGMPSRKKIGSKQSIIYVYENGLLKSQTDPEGNRTRYEYNSLGQMIRKIDPAGNATQYTYDLMGNLLTATDANSKTVTNVYDGNYQKISVTDANGNRTQYSYNGNMKLTETILPDGNSITYGYDGEDRVKQTKNQAGEYTYYRYDKAGQLAFKQMADNARTTYLYDKAGRVIKETGPMGAATITTYDANGNVLSVTDHAGNTTSYEYDAMSRPIRKVNPAMGATTYIYSAAGDLICETDALNNSKRYTYDAFGNKLTFTDARGNTTVYTYDENNNLLTVTDALNNVTTYTYNSLNQLVSVTDARNNTTTYGYDALGRRVSVTDARNNTTYTAYDANGNVTSVTDGEGNVVIRTSYNNLNLPVSVTDAMNKTTSYTYNAIGKIATVTDSNNNKHEYTYDVCGRNTQVKDPQNGLSNATYDKLGNITVLSGPLGGKTEYSYDAIGRLISETTTSGGTVTYGYNEFNLREELTNAKGQKRTYSYDVMGRITGYESVDNAVYYTYDANGNVLTVSDSNGTITRTYDALNRVTSCTDTFGNTISYIYDAVGNLIRIIYPDNTYVRYVYYENNLLARVIDWAERETDYYYDSNNRVIRVTKPDGSETTTAYDSAQRVTSSVERTATGTVITGFEYTYDDLSRIIEEKVLANYTKMCYTYDSLNRVTARTIKNLTDDTVISTETFTYDAAGNITDDSADTTFVYDTNNRLTSYNGNSVSYDLDGNMLSNGEIACTYDSANRLITAGGHTYTYNAENVRIRNLCEDAETTYTYNTNCRLSQLLMKTTNGITTKYVYGLGLIGEEKLGCFKTYHFDSRGSTVAITDIDGNITDTFKYDTYGKLIDRTGTSFVIFGYNGRDGVVTDKNGLIYMRARYYSPDMRRFVNADIIHGEISDSTSLNRYAYVNGNPVSFVDPFGLAKWWETALKIAAGVAVVATLVAVTVATAGTATAVIAGAAAVGATVSGAANVVGGVIAGDSADEIASSFLAGTISGAASGALTASGAGPGLIATMDVAIDVGELYLEDFINDGKINAVDIEDVVWTIEFGLFTEINSNPIKKLDSGWLNKKGAFYQTQEYYTEKIAREGRRANEKAAKKKIKNAKKYYNSAYSNLLENYAIDSAKDEVKEYVDKSIFQQIFGEEKFKFQYRSK